MSLSYCVLRRGSSSTPLLVKSWLLRRLSSTKAVEFDHLSANKVLFQSLGCPRNLVDTEVMLGQLLQKGFEPTNDISIADYVVLNTCGFLQSARDESRQEIQALLDGKKTGSKLIVTGCMVNLHKEQICQDFPQVDQVLGAGSVEKILDAVISDSPIDEHTAGRSYLESGQVPRLLSTPPHYAYLKIAEGCRKRCSFCIIPKIKGKLQSKSVDQIIRESQALVDSGVKEIILIAQDLGDYGKDNAMKNGLTEMLRELVLAIDDPNLWIRLLYLYPDEITDELIDLLEQEPRICRYLDMPIQHMSDRILRKMRRKTSSKDIEDTIAKLRSRLPDIHIRTSLMVGFPTETDEDFQQLLQFVKTAKLDNVGVFQYSNEEMAPSSRLENHVDDATKKQRYDELMEAQLQVVREKNAARVGSTMDVVVEGLHKEAPELVVGRYYGQCPDIDGQVILVSDSPPIPGERYKVQIIDFEDYDLVGKIMQLSRESK